MFFDESTFGPYDNSERKAQRAYELYEDGNINQALTELNDAIEINPSSSALHFNKALALDTMSKFEDAIGEYEIALALNPVDPEILNSLAVDHTRTGHYDLALQTFEHIHEIDSSFEPCYCNRIITYTEMGQHELAEQMFYMAQQLNPDCALCYYNIGNSLFSRGQYKKAIHCWLRTAELEPTHPQIYYRIAQALWAEGEFERSRESFLKELRINPGDVDVIIDFGLFLLNTGQVEAAKEKFNRALEQDPGCAAAIFYLGETECACGNIEQAHRLYDRAIDRDGSLLGPRFRLAQIALGEGDYQRAKSYLASEVRHAPENSDVLVSMASMFLELQRKCPTVSTLENPEMDYAMHCLLRAIDINSSNPDAYYYLGVLNAMKGQLENAVELFGSTLDIDSEHLGALADSAAVSIKLGRFERAEELLARAMKISGGDNSRLKQLNRTLKRQLIKEKLKSGLFRSRSQG